jgi:predicted dienelactone hydrolase
MRTYPRRSIALVTLALLAASCAASDGESAETTPATESTATDSSAETEAPVATEPPGTEAPAATEPPADPSTSEAPVETEPPEPENAEDIALDLAYGDYEVGVQTITLTDTSGGGRDLTVDVWFPIDLGTDVEAEAARYTLIEGTYYESPFALAASADSIATDGPFPLVIYSHGSGGIRYVHSNYTEALASNGYIVAAADHTGNTAADQLLGTEVDGAITAFNRPNDVQRVIDAFLDPESIETVGYVASVNPGQIAVTGHSFGGFTSYAMASGFSNDQGEFVADERVAAIIPLAPAAGPSLLTDEQLASIDIPALVMVGTNDQTTPIDPNVTRPWELTASSPSYRVDLTAAEHETFTDLCAYQAFLPTLPDALPAVIDTINERTEAGCGPDDMPIDRAQAITNTFAVAFLDEVFKGGEPIALDQVDEQTDLAYQVKP